jgi:hypothetical protein
MQGCGPLASSGDELLGLEELFQVEELPTSSQCQDGD